MEDYQKKIKEKLNVVPLEPGCYLMKDRNDQVIYVGKAKKLRNRLRSYFTGAHDAKTTRLVSEIRNLSNINHVTIFYLKTTKVTHLLKLLKKSILGLSLHALLKRELENTLVLIQMRILHKKLRSY